MFALVVVIDKECEDWATVPTRKRENIVDDRQIELVKISYLCLFDRREGEVYFIQLINFCTS